jgi:hypothetical protein
MFPFGVTIPATVLQGSEIPEGLITLYYGVTVFPEFRNGIFFLLYVKIMPQ